MRITAFLRIVVFLRSVTLPRIVALALVPGIAFGQAPSVHDLAQRVDRHYNHLTSLRATYVERYRGMGQEREEHGMLLLKKPGRMRWTYASGKLFVLDGKSAISYSPGDAQAQRISAKELDDLRSPLRFLLGHTELEKELDHLSASPAGGGAVTLSGTPRYATGSGEQRIQTIAVTFDSVTGVIQALQVVEIDGSTTEFRFSDLKENVPAASSEFQFIAPAGVAIVDGLPPA